MAGSSGSTETDLFVFGILILFLARRSYRMATGTRVRFGLLFVMAGLYGALWAWSVWEAYLALPLVATVADLGLLAVGVGLALPYIRRVVHFEQRADGMWYYRLGVAIPLIYIVLLVARLAVGVAYLGPGAVDLAPVPVHGLGAPAEVALALVNALLSVSTGLLLGRATGIYLGWRAEPRTDAARPTSGS